MSAAQREDLIIKFGGVFLFDLAREAFKKSHVSTQLTVREPVNLMTAAQVRSGELGGARGVHSESSTAGDESARDSGASRRSGGVNGPAEATVDAPGSADHVEGPESDGDGGSTASGGGDDSDGHAESPLAPGPSAPVRDTSATATAAEIAASSPGRIKSKKRTAVGLLREYLESKRGAEQTSGEEGGTSANDVRQALVNMMNAYAEKARRGLGVGGSNSSRGAVISWLQKNEWPMTRKRRSLPHQLSAVFDKRAPSDVQPPRCTRTLTPPPALASVHPTEKMAP